MKLYKIVKVIKAVEDTEKIKCGEGGECPICKRNHRQAIYLKKQGLSYKDISKYIT